MVRFIGIKIEDGPQVPSVSCLSFPLWKKFNLVFIKPRVGLGSRNCVPSVISPVQSLPPPG